MASRGHEPDVYDDIEELRGRIERIERAATTHVHIPVADVDVHSHDEPVVFIFARPTGGGVDLIAIWPNGTETVLGSQP